jgi:hypothetical protein
MLFLRACTLPEGSAIGGLAKTTRCCGRQPSAEIVRGADGSMKAIDSADSDRNSIALVMFRPRTFRRGLWAPTTERHERILRISPVGPMKAEDEAGIRIAYGAWLRTAEQGRWAMYAPGVLAGDSVTTRILWAGVVEDVIAASLALLLIFSIRSAPEWPAINAPREDPRSLALRRCECPGCGYDIRGLPRPLCPECGETWTPGARTIVT